MVDEQWVDPLARTGLAARALVYALIAWTVVEILRGRTARQADARGALGALAAHTPGRVVVVAVAAGLGGLAVWQVSIALRRDPGASRRLVAFAKSLAYAAVAATAATAAVGPARGERHALTARLMSHLIGRIAIGIVGGAVAVVGAVFMIKGAESRYDVDVDSPGRAFEVFGAVAMVARGAIFAMVGGFLVDAAVTFDPDKARGLDGALRSLARDPGGPWWLALVAAGLAVFAGFSALEARYVRT